MLTAALPQDPPARPFLPPLSPLHAALFAACLDLANPTLRDLADATGLSPAEAAAHLADAALQPWIAAAASLQAQRAAILHADASLAAVLALTHICRTSDNPVEVRRAATTILQGARTLLTRRTDRSPDRPTPQAPNLKPQAPPPKPPPPRPLSGGPHGATPSIASSPNSEGRVGGPPPPPPEPSRLSRAVAESQPAAPSLLAHHDHERSEAPDPLAPATALTPAQALLLRAAQAGAARPLTRAERRRMNQRIPTSVARAPP
ncbi:MAG: hypothetical protein KJZ54_01820 [Phycisphaerales bacterium]|nr:hypothetical protein [Phycisphaerales bacterium]